MDGQYVTHIHHVSHLRNMRETCAKRQTCVMPCANLAKRARNMCETSRIIANPRIISESRETPRNIAKHARNMRETCVMPCVNLAKHRETCAKHVRNVASPASHTGRPYIGNRRTTPAAAYSSGSHTVTQTTEQHVRQLCRMPRAACGWAHAAPAGRARPDRRSPSPRLLMGVPY